METEINFKTNFADIAAVAREERDTQLRVYIIFSHRWKCNIIVCL
jgi:hypothetical protein